MAKMRSRGWSASVALVALALVGCGREPESSLGTSQGALVTPSAEFSLDREVEALETELAEVPLEERFALRAERLQAAEDAARRRSLDDGADLMATLAAIRERIAEAPEAQEEFAAAERARVGRNESFVVTDEDRANDEQVRRELRLDAFLAERARTIAAARREDIAAAARHVDPPEFAVDISALQESFSDTEVRHGE
jgi:hypothetical protein